MKDRLKQFMDYKSMSAAELADLIGVQRSNVSHVLNGRNNPSAIFLEKLLQQFPELDARWLIVGEGNMLNDPDKESPKPQPDLFTHISNKEKSPPITQLQGPESDKSNDVEQIIIFNKDGSFRQYKPSQV